MIGFMPGIYPDELVYSWFARYFMKSGYAAYRDAFKDLYKDYRIKPSIEFINMLNDESNSIINAIVPVSELICNHTMLPYYIRFLTAQKKQNGLLNMLNGGIADRKSLSLPVERNGRNRFMRYCPLCFLHDREVYGEAYWHRLHQLREVDICHIHYCKLLDSNIMISSRGAPRLFPLDIEKTDNRICEERDENARRLAAYVSEVIVAPVNFASDIRVGEFLDSKLEHTVYVSSSGLQRNMTALYKDYADFYNNNNVMSMWQLEKLFAGNRIRTFEVCQLAMFLGLKPYELIDVELPMENIKQRARLRQKIPNWNNRPGPKALNYLDIDEHMLPLVKDVAYNLYSGNGERPKRVTVNGIERLLGLPCKRMSYLPNCLLEIQKYAETYEQYWIREIIWAIKKLESENIAINYRHIRDLTNISRENFYKVKGNLKLAEITSKYIL